MHIPMKKSVPRRITARGFREDADTCCYEKTYFEKPPVGDFYFGDTPSVPSPVRPAPVVPMNPQYQAPTPPATVPDEDGYDDEEVAFGEEITDISSSDRE